MLLYALLLKMDVTSTDNYNPGLMGRIMSGILMLPVYSALLSTVLLELQPVREAWRLENELRKKIYLEPQTFWAFFAGVMAAFVSCKKAAARRMSAVRTSVVPSKGPRSRSLHSADPADPEKGIEMSTMPPASAAKASGRRSPRLR